MIDKRGREYLKMSKPAFIADVDREEGGRPARRIKGREILKKARWRQLRDILGLKHKISFRRRLALTEYALRQR